MKNKIKKAMLIILSITIMLGGTGCMFKSAYKQMESYMEKKYNEEFTIIEASGSSIMSGSSDRSAIFSSEKFPGQRIDVSAREGDDGKYHFKDNYAGFLLKDKVTEFFANLAKPIYKDCKISFHPESTSPMPPEYGKDTTVEKLVARGQMYMSIFLSSNVDITKKDEDIKKFAEKLKEYKVFADVTVWYLTDESLENINMEKYDYSNDFIYDNEGLFKNVGLITINPDGKIFYKNWRGDKDDKANG